MTINSNRAADSAMFETGASCAHLGGDLELAGGLTVAYSVRLTNLTSEESGALRSLVHTGHLAGCDAERYGGHAAVMVGDPRAVLTRLNAATVGRPVTPGSLNAHNAIRRRLWVAIDGDDARRAASEARATATVAGARGCISGIDRGDIVTFAHVQREVK